jgi:hypothetical protein
MDMKRVFAAIAFSMAFVMPAWANDAGWFVGGMIVNEVFHHGHSHQRDVIIVQQPQTVIVQPQPYYGGQVIMRQQSLVAPGQPYMVDQYRSYSIVPPSYINGAAYCPPGMILRQKVMPYGNIENVGCTY